MIGLCTDCPKRPHCNTLCPEAELYASQDWEDLQEITVGLPEYSKEDIAEKELQRKLNKFYQLPRKKQVLTLLERGLPRKEVCQILGITKENLRDIIRRISKDLTISPKDRE